MNSNTKFLLSLLIGSLLAPITPAQEKTTEETIQASVQELEIVLIPTIDQEGKKINEDHRFSIQFLFTSQQYQHMKLALDQSIKLTCLDSNNKTWTITGNTPKVYSNLQNPTLQLFSAQIPSQGSTWVHIKGKVPMAIAQKTQTTLIKGFRLDRPLQSGPFSLSKAKKIQMEYPIEIPRSGVSIDITSSQVVPIQMKISNKELDLPSGTWTANKKNTYCQNIYLPHSFDKSTPLDLEISYWTPQIINVPIDFTITLGNATPQ